MLKTKIKKSLILILASLTAVGCASTVTEPGSAVEAGKLGIKSSYLEQADPVAFVENAEVTSQSGKSAEFLRLNRNKSTGLKLEIDLSDKFGSEKNYQISVNELPMNDFVHYVLGNLLKVSYLIEPKVKTNITPVTLELKEKVTAQRLFQLVQQVLVQNNVSITLNDDVFFVYPLTSQNDKSNMAFGFGAKHKDVPNVSSNIIQLVPVKYGTSTGLRSTVASLVNATVAIDPDQGLISLQGKREQILRALSLIELLDSQAIHDKSIALLGFEYIDSETYIEKISQLLVKEGISIGGNRGVSSSVDFIPLEHLGKVVVFASADEIIDRVEFWTEQLDKPATGAEQSFYVYHPKYARASDLGQSLGPLLKSDYSPVNRTENVSSSADSRQTNKANSQTKTVEAIHGDNLRLVVDERANALIFYSSGKQYQELQPIIRKLDIMPKQVMLEVVIAEVKLTGSFAKGVSFALKNRPSGNRVETFSFNSEDGFGYSIVGLDGNINVNLNEKDGLVNVLSRPTLLVRDGVAATISVGDDIPTVGSTTSDPDGERQTTSVQYRKTGVDLAVTPTINAQGTVIMTIEQSISSVAEDGLTVQGSPSVFERSISTEVVAADGQSVLLGGLISENKTTNAAQVPVLGSIPVLGHLFRSDSESTDKTEMVVLVTPKIVSNADEWQRIQKSFMKGLENIKF